MSKLDTDIAQNTAAIAQAEERLYSSAEADKISLTAQQRSYKSLSEAQHEIGELEKQLDQERLSIADSELFIKTLQRKVNSLRDAELTRTYVWTASFETCPACHTPVEQPPSNPTKCPLCKESYGAETFNDRMLNLLNDAGTQIKQSESLQKKRQQKLAELGKRYAAAQGRWNGLASHWNSVQRLPSSAARDDIRALTRQAGYLERQKEEASKTLSMLELLDKLSLGKEKLNQEIALLKSRNESIRLMQRSRLSKAYTEIAEIVRKLLRSDLRRQDSFENAENIQFSFDTNRISVDEESYFSASSRAILKSSFCSGFMFAATQEAFFRHPRFAMIDTLENMGVETVRSQNFQRQLAALSGQATSCHQLIVATAMISVELNNPSYRVGRHSTRDAPMLLMNMG